MYMNYQLPCGKISYGSGIYAVVTLMSFELLTQLSVPAKAVHSASIPLTGLL